MSAGRATRRTRRKLSAENSHELHKNPYSGAQNIYLAMEWAKVHHAICAQCRRRVERMNRPEALQQQIEKRMGREVDL